jgi:hypothetical protein
VDYRKFLAQDTRLVLPFLGGAHVVGARRRFRLTESPAEPGWWTFTISGRKATPVERAAAPELDGLDKVTGHLHRDHIFLPGARTHLVNFLPDDEPMPFTLCSARRWHSGDLLFDMLEFESEAEEEARRAFEDGIGLAQVRGVPATLRAAFGYAVAERVARASDVSLNPLEVRRHLLAIAERGPEVAEELVGRVLAIRAEQIERARRRDAARRARELARELARDPVGRAERALAAAGAEPLGIRRLGQDQLEVRYRFDGERFRTIVMADTLQVIDAGFCLAGADRELTLESLPSAIREAIQTHRLEVW